MKAFEGKVLFLDRGDINTDEIIPAKYLTEVAKSALKPYCFEDLELPFFDPKRDLEGVAVIVTRENFGCGSSREHAPWALEAKGINAVVASSFARIFRGNMFNCGMLALALGNEAIDELFRSFKGRETSMKVDWAGRRVSFSAELSSRDFHLELGGFERALIEAGGWLEYAAANY
jgi:3-isopropylmalate/(R)-2-methylmalate dehydratase small subunit